MAQDLDLIGLEVVMIMKALDMVAMIMAQDLDLIGQEVDMIMEALDMVAMIMAQDLDLIGQEVDTIMIMVQFLAKYLCKTLKSNSIYNSNINEFQFTNELKPSETLDVKISSVFVCIEINLV